MMDRAKAAVSMALIAATTLANFFTFDAKGESGATHKGTAGWHANKKRTTAAGRKRKAKLRRAAQQFQRRLIWSRTGH